MLLKKTLTALFIVSLISGCATKLRLAEHDQAPSNTITNEQPLQIQYLGVGGHRMQFGEAVVVTGP